MNRNTIDAEEAYAESLIDPMKAAEAIGQADIVIGLPFQDEADTIGHVCATVIDGLEEFFPDQKRVLVCAGGSNGHAALQAIEGVPLGQDVERISFLMANERVRERVWTLRATMDIANRLGADLAVFEPDLGSKRTKRHVEGLAPDWVRRLLWPIRSEDFDLVTGRFERHYLDAPCSTHLTLPLLAAIFNLRVGDMPGAVLGISRRLLGLYLGDPHAWRDHVWGQALDTRLVSAAIASGANMCQANLGVRLDRGYRRNEEVWEKQVKEIFEAVATHKDWWQQRGDVIRTIPTHGEAKGHRPSEVSLDPGSLIDHYRDGFSRYLGLYEEVLSREALAELRKLAGTRSRVFRFPASLWAQVVCDFLISYCHEQESPKANILDSFIPVCCARQAAFALEVGAYKDRLQAAYPAQAEYIATIIAKSFLEQQVEEFIERRADFLGRWRQKEQRLKRLLPEVTYREFVPGFPIIAPKQLTAPDGRTINTDSIYQTILERHRSEFQGFVRETLGLPDAASAEDIVASLRDLLLNAENEVGRLLLAGDLSTTQGTISVAQAMFENFPHSQAFALKPGVVFPLLQRFPPKNLLIRYGAASLGELERQYGPNDILALASLSEEMDYMVSLWEWIAGNARPEQFDRLALEPLVVSSEDFPTLTQLKEPSILVKLAGRVVISDMPKGAGGDFPKLRYALTTAKNIVEAESLGTIWEQYARERKEFGTKVANSLRGHWGRDPFSAHNIFESRLQSELIEHLRSMISALERGADATLLNLTRDLKRLADCYHLAQSLPDGTFLPCSAWTWSSYSFKGGKGVPTPFSLHVERDWASRAFLVGTLKAVGISEEHMEREIAELMGRGMESDNLAQVLLRGWEAVEEVMPEQLPRSAEPEANRLTRFGGNPILKAIPEHSWESKYVFNAGVIRLDGKIHILYRACGEDEVSRIGLAVSPDGFRIDERLERPVFEPSEDWERRGCEDPRLVLLDDRIHMLYTAYDSITPQIALASIDRDDFRARRWGKWKRHGLVFPGSDNKDATLFPEKFKGRYVMYHRVEPSVWVCSSDSLGLPWPREDHRILVGPGVGTAWDGFKIGGGSQPIKTKYGWLVIYHGVDQSFVYRLGVLLVGLDDPGRLLYRSPNPVLEPEARYELGEEGCYVPNVVFTCGALPSVERDLLDDDDEVLVYYGAADTAVCVATATVAELIPAEVRFARGWGRR